MDGLEAVEINSKLVIEKERLDTEFFRKDFIKSLQLLERIATSSLDEIAHVSDGNHLSIAESFDVGSGVRYLRGQDISTDMLLDDRNPVFIPASEYQKLSRSHIFKDDVLVTIVGANTGLTGLVYNAPEELTANCKLGIIRVNKKNINSAFVYSFLASKFGQFQILMNKRGGGQTGLILPDLRNLQIPVLGYSLINTVASITRQGHEELVKARVSYQQAETLLLSELGLSNWQPTTESIEVKSFKNSFLSSGRLDAEYYQPKYDEYFDLLAKSTQKRGWPLTETKLFSEPLKYGSSTKLEYLETGAPFLRIADLEDYQFADKKLKYITQKDAEQEGESSTVQTNDVLISRSGTLGLTVVIPEVLNRAIFGSYFIRIRPNLERINPEYLALFMNSLAGQVQVEQVNTGGIQTNLTIPVIESFKIPLPDLETQSELVKKVFQSRRTKQQSMQLLEIAKLGVERAIEEDEETALAWMEAEVKNIELES